MLKKAAVVPPSQRRFKGSKKEKNTRLSSQILSKTQDLFLVILVFLSISWSYLQTFVGKICWSIDSVPRFVSLTQKTETNHQCFTQPTLSCGEIKMYKSNSNMCSTTSWWMWEIRFWFKSYCSAKDMDFSYSRCTDSRPHLWDEFFDYMFPFRSKSVNI